VEHEQLELCAKLAVVAFLGLFQPVEVFVEGFPGRPGGSVDPLKLGVFCVAQPVGPRDLEQLEVLGLLGAHDVGPAAEIDELAPVLAAVAVDGHALDRQAPDVLDLEDLAALAEVGDRVFLGPLFAFKGLVLLDHLLHGGLDLREIVLGDGDPGDVDVVVEAVFDGGTEGQPGVRPDLEDRLGHHVGGRVAQAVQLVGVI